MKIVAKLKNKEKLKRIVYFMNFFPIYYLKNVAIMTWPRGDLVFDRRLGGSLTKNKSRVELNFFHRISDVLEVKLKLTQSNIGKYVHLSY